MIWNTDRSNLECILEDVARLSESIDAERVVVTGDRGNSISEWSLYSPVGTFRSGRKMDKLFN